MSLSNNFTKTKSNKLTATLILLTRERFEIKVNYNEKVIGVIKSIKSSSYDFISRTWNVSLSDYKETVKSLSNLGILDIRALPISITKVFHNSINGLPPPRDPSWLVSENDFQKVDSKIREFLFPFQVKGVKFMIGRNGRCLLADDMGLGKTIQSLGAASFYRNEWPLLVISPSSVKMAWRDQIRKWISEPLVIHVISTKKDLSNGDLSQSLNTNSVVLISYDLVSRLSSDLMKFNFKVIIMDESHFIKSSLTARAKGCVPLAKKAKRVFLLSGTPALSRPSEMFTQIDVVAPTLYNGFFKEFGTRYCDPQNTNWGVSYNGSSNTTELQILLNETIMLRRLKNEVLSQLPEKHREVIILAPEFLEKASLKRHADIMVQKNLKNLQRRGALLEYFQATGKAKIDAIKNYIDDLVESPRKFLFFAHHLDVLNAVEDQVIKKKIGYIRIDGSTSADQKRIRAQKFEKDENIQMAILSIVAAGTGINLTSASLVVFGELFWNPGVLLQAENRCHRIGQKDFVNIHYLVAEKTADDYIWPLVQSKMELLMKVGLNKETFKSSETKRLEESFTEKDKPQTLLDYFQTDFMEEVNLEEMSDSIELNNNSNFPDDSVDAKNTEDFDSFDEKLMAEFDSFDENNEFYTLPTNTKDNQKPESEKEITSDNLQNKIIHDNSFDEDIFLLLQDGEWESPDPKKFKS